MESEEELAEVDVEEETCAAGAGAAGQRCIILMDIYMPQVDGLRAAKKIRARFPEIAIVMPASSERDDHLYEAVKIGVAGYLFKNMKVNDISDLLNGVAKGEPAMTRAMAGKFLKSMANWIADEGKGEQALSERKLFVLRLVVSGASN